jgi:hypothetical protein
MFSAVISVETISGMGWGRRIMVRGWIEVWYIWYIVRTFVNATMYPHPTLKLKNTKCNVVGSWKENYYRGCR